MDIAVLIVDDFPIVREGIARALELDPGIRVVGEASTAAEALELAPRLRPDVVVLDLRLPDADGVTIVEELRASAAGIAIIVLTASEQTEGPLEAASAGVAGYLTKRVSGAELRAAVITVYGGGTAFESSIADELGRDHPKISTDSSAAVSTRLTPREKQVLALLAEDHTDREIAELLELSARTVQNHLSRIRTKTGTHRRTELVRWAVRHALG